jgi:mannose-6-phosphate isomerase
VSQAVPAVLGPKPVILGPNQPPRFYRGGERIAAFRGLAAQSSGSRSCGRQSPGSQSSGSLSSGSQPSGSRSSESQPSESRSSESRSSESRSFGRLSSGRLPEDWVGSVTQVFGTVASGLTRLPGGEQLRAAIDADPVGYLGPAHVARHGSSPALLVKLLDAGERLPAHCHPGDAFACKHLASPYGKTEAWIVIDAAADSVVYLGFSEAVSSETLAGWVTAQDPAIVAAMNRVPVAPGDAILVPAGTPHAIGEGVFIVELQQPTDLSVLLEWDSFPLDDAAAAHLGLGFGLALSCVDRSAWDAVRLAGLRGPGLLPGAGQLPGAGPGDRPLPVQGILPAAAGPFFGAQRIRPELGPVTLDPSFAILVVISGAGLLRSEPGDHIPLSAGMTVLMPYAAGRSEIQGACEVIRCLPPDAAASPLG